jgi:hypothetical protein
MEALQEPRRPDQARPLEAGVAARMGHLLDFDLTGVEVVPESAAVTGTTKAVTKDDQVHFRPGAYQPGTADGDWLIAHELAHVVQQQVVAASAPERGESEAKRSRGDSWQAVARRRSRWAERRPPMPSIRRSPRHRSFDVTRRQGDVKAATPSGQARGPANR